MAYDYKPGGDDRRQVAKEIAFIVGFFILACLIGAVAMALGVR